MVVTVCYSEFGYSYYLGKCCNSHALAPSEPLSQKLFAKRAAPGKNEGLRVQIRRSMELLWACIGANYRRKGTLSS